MTSSTAESVTIIRAQNKASDYWQNLWHYRELLYFLAWRDVLVRYKQTTLGVAWALLRPVLTMIVFVIVFSYIAKLPSSGTVPYGIMVFAALLPWQFFASSVSVLAESLTNNANMVSKIYFPRLIMPLSSMAPIIMDFLISMLVLIGLYGWYDFIPTWRIVFLPVFSVLLMLLASGIGVFLAALNVSYRDFRYIVPFGLQIGLYASPVGYSSHIVPAAWHFVYALNPMVGIIDGFRWCLLNGQETLYIPGLIVSIVMTILSLVVGISYFRRVELYFADRI